MWELQPYCRRTSTDLKRLEVFSMQISDAECKEIKGVESKISLGMYRPEHLTWKTPFLQYGKIVEGFKGKTIHSKSLITKRIIMNGFTKTTVSKWVWLDWWVGNLELPLNLLRLVWIKELLNKRLPYSRTIIIMGEVSPAQGNTFLQLD